MIAAATRRTIALSSAGAIVAGAIVAGAIILTPYRSATAGPDDGAQLAALCASCHRLDGRDQRIPAIVGRDEQDLVRVMQDHKSGEREGFIMHAVGLSLSDAEIVTVAHYLATRAHQTTRP
jgi:cytochrome c553